MSFDRDSFMSLIEGDKELFTSLLHLFEEDWPVLIAKIRICIKDSKTKNLEETAHRLKGSLRNFYATRGADLAHQLEAGVRLNQLQNLDRVVNELVKEIEKVQADLRQFLKEMD